MRLLPDKPRAVWIASAKGAIALMDKRNLSLISAGVAFFSLLSLFPTLSAFVSIWSLFADPGSIGGMLETLRSLTPPGAYEIMADQVTTLAGAPSSALTWAGALSLILALWSAKAGVSALTRGLNAVYGEENRSGFRHLVTVLTLTVGLVLLTATFAALLVGLPVLLALLPLGPLAMLAIMVVKWVVMAGLLIAALAVIYRWAPNRRDARWEWLSPGALGATVIWTLASLAFSIYVGSFGNYNEVYGSLGAVVALLMWFYLSAMVVLLGAALNAELERHSAEDSTVGPAKPIGSRGAQAADTYIPVSG